MTFTVVCANCRYHDVDPNIEFNFRDGKVYYLCPKCKKESTIGLKAETIPYPKPKRI